MIRSLVVLVLVALGTAAAAPKIPPDLCVTALSQDEPLCNPALSGGPWEGTHRGPYSQASSPLHGIDPAQTYAAKHVDLKGVPITWTFSSPYKDGGRAVWSSLLGTFRTIVKLDHETFQVVDEYVPADREPDPPVTSLGISGAYNLIDRDNHFISVRDRTIEVYADGVPGDRFSAVTLLRRFELPADFFCRSTDLLVGITMTPDGWLGIVSQQGMVAVVPRQPYLMTPENVRTLSLNGGRCADAGIPTENLETISNSIASDEHGGIYVVTSEAMYKFAWDGRRLTQTWRAAYETGGDPMGARLGVGSGSTPTLMGTALADDAFVVITDGQELMHLVLFWRDDIPAGWQPVAPGKDPRIACEMAVRFGDPLRTRSQSEQSVLVAGYAATVVNNELLDQSRYEGLALPQLRTIAAGLDGGDPTVAPRGLERIDWDPLTRTCNPVWTNTQVSLPNGVPGMSRAGAMVYVAGQRAGAWGMEAVDFTTGASLGFLPSPSTACTQAEDLISPLVKSFILDWVATYSPGQLWCENSFYAATEVGPDGTIYTGTLQGATQWKASVPEAVAPFVQVVAGVGQGQDLCERALAALPGDGVRALAAVRRGVLQMNATKDALKPIRSRFGTVRNLVRRAKRGFKKAARAIARGDAAGAATRIQEARAALDQAAALLGGS